MLPFGTKIIYNPREIVGYSHGQGMGGGAIHINTVNSNFT